MTMPNDSAWSSYFDVSANGNHAHPASQNADTLGVGGAGGYHHDMAHPSPQSASHLSPPAEGGPLSPCSTIEPSDSVSRTHSPPHSTVNLEEDIPRQVTDEENMVALNDILSRAAKHQKNLRMSRLAGRGPLGGAISAPAPTAPVSGSPVRSLDSSSNGTPTPDGPVLNRQQSPPKTSPQATAPAPVLANVDAHMMPPDPFAENGQSQIHSSSLPLNASSPPANPFSSPPPRNVLNLGAESDPNAIPWTKELIIVGLFTKPGVASPISEPVQLPVLIAAELDQNV